MLANTAAVANPSVSVYCKGSAVLLPFQAAATMPSRERFHVELKPGETTFVSWKKLLKDFEKAGTSSSGEAPVGAHPALEARIAPEVLSQKDPLPPPPNRFSSVIEKIERIYKGGNSSDENENLSDLQDDDQYDTQDSFIDDADLNDYFKVDKAKMKHTGFFVNRGMLERETEPTASPIVGPKKRKRKDTKKLGSEIKEDIPKKLLKSGVRLKDAARKVPSSTLDTSGALEKTFVTTSALNKQTNQESKEARNPSSRPKAGKDRDGMKGGEVLQGAAVDRSMGHPTQMNMTALQNTQKLDANVKRDGIAQLEEKQATVLELIKEKAAQKGLKDEVSRQAIGNAATLHPGNARPSSPACKEVSPGRLKGTALERALQDLERGVAQWCPSLADHESEQGKRIRLPQDIKQKLAKVARLVPAKQGLITDELISRLMGILGHVVSVKTLKRNLKEMIEVGLSAIQEKEGRLQDIKREVTEMVKSRVHTLQAQDVEQRETSSDDFQPLVGSAEKASNEGRYHWDHATEDKICDLYEQYIEGMDEHRGPQSRKLYGELAELWPDGWMDNIGIKHAVHRAKERKKKQRKASNSEEESRKKKSGAKQKLELRTERAALLDLNQPGQDLSSHAKIRCSDFLETEVLLHHENEMSVSSGERRKYLRKSSGRSSGRNERKRNKVEGGPVLKKKKRKLEKGVLDNMVSITKKSSTHADIIRSGVKGV